MKTFLSLILFWTGHLISFFLRWNCFAFFYPLYNWLMTSSLTLDTKEKVWTQYVFNKDKQDSLYSKKAK